MKKDGTNPIMGRITVDGTMAQFSCKVSCDPVIWEAKGGHAKGKSVAARDVNRELDKIKATVVKHYQEIMIRDGYVTAEVVMQKTFLLRIFGLNVNLILRFSPKACRNDILKS